LIDDSLTQTLETLLANMAAQSAANTNFLVGKITEIVE
jgi:hypothetical protein